jgi:hypothetical protein
MVLVSEATAWPTDIWNVQGLQSRNDIIPDPSSVWDFGIGPNPDAFVNAVAEVFGELTENIAVDLGSRFGAVHRQRNTVLRSSEWRQDKNYYGER